MNTWCVCRICTADTYCLWAGKSSLRLVNTESASQTAPRSDYEASRTDSGAIYPFFSSWSITFYPSTSGSPDCDSRRHRRWQILSGECPPWLWPTGWKWSLPFPSLSWHGLVHKDYFVWDWPLAWSGPRIHGNIVSDSWFILKPRKEWAENYSNWKAFHLISTIRCSQQT